MPHAKNSDVKPKGRMSAYAFFVQRTRQDHKKSHPDENVVFSDFSRKCAERWKTMDDNAKQSFFDLAESDKDRYDSEMVGYGGPMKGGRGGAARKRRQRKDPNAPKRALSAFFWFCGEERAKVRAKTPNLGIGDVAKELGQRWAVIDPDVKAKWEEMAKKDKARYQSEMEDFKSGNYLSSAQLAAQAAPQNNFNDDSDQDMDDDDESD